MPEPADKEALALFARRDGVPTIVILNSGQQVIVHNIAWGYDEGDTHAHVTTNISPEVTGASIDVFSTSVIQSMGDLVSGETLA